GDEQHLHQPGIDGAQGGRLPRRGRTAGVEGDGGTVPAQGALRGGEADPGGRSAAAVRPAVLQGIHAVGDEARPGTALRLAAEGGGRGVGADRVRKGIMDKNQSTGLLFELSPAGRRCHRLPECDVPAPAADRLLPAAALAETAPPLPEVGEIDLVRHYVNLSG